MKTLALLMGLLGLWWAGNGFAADVNYFGVIKLQQFYQTNASPPVIASNGYSFQAFVNASSGAALSNATVKPSNGTPLRTLLPSSDPTIWRFEEAFASLSALEATYPAGSSFAPVNYVLAMQTQHDGAPSVSLNFFLLFLPVSYPTTPQIQNWSSGQVIDHTSDFTITWNNLGGSSLAIVQLLIMDGSSNILFATPAPFQAGALGGSSTQVVVPALSLPPAANLIGHLTIANPGTPNTNSYPGAVGVPALAKDTYFTLATRPVPSSPRIEARASVTNVVIVRVIGETNRIFHLEGSATLGSWANLLTTNSTTGLFEYPDPLSSSLPARFYRARIGQ